MSDEPRDLPPCACGHPVTAHAGGACAFCPCPGYEPPARGDLFADQSPPKVEIPCPKCALPFEGDDEAAVLAAIEKEHDCAGWQEFHRRQRERFAALRWE